MILYNDLTRQKEELIPIDKENIKIYCCGPTVYNYFHIGNARPFIIFDALRCFLEYTGNKVTYVQNFTDIDDKMINRANADGITVKELADKFIAEYFVDARGLGIKYATSHPKATEHMEEIINMVKTLIEKGYAYTIDGDVYFRVSAFGDYGKLSHMPIDELEQGARVGVDEDKENPLDFALWKASKPGEPYWTAPWGEGRPGWHIECSAMANKYLGKMIDIHCGGVDLTFPHHDNEIAQSEAANGTPFAKYWLHNGFINIDNKKMSKSEGNFFNVRDVAKEYSYEVIRFFMLSAHYRSPINYSREIIEQAKAGLTRLYNCKSNLEFLLKTASGDTLSHEERASLEKIKVLENNFIEALSDDFNTADAIAALFEIAREINTTAAHSGGVSYSFLESAKVVFTRLSGILGLCCSKTDDGDVTEIEELIEQRQLAKQIKDYKTADEIRNKLRVMGIALEDTLQGVKWTRI